MDSRILSDLIAYVGLYSGFLPASLALVRWPYLRGSVRVFGVLQLAGVVIVVLSTWVLTQNNAYLSHLDTSLDALAMGMMYGPLVPARRWGRAVLVGGIIFAAAVWVDYAGAFGTHRRGYGFMAGLECILMSGLLLYLLGYWLGNDRLPALRRQPLVLISAGILAESLVAIPVYFFMDALVAYSNTLALRAYDLLFSVVALANGLYAYAFWLTRSAAPFSHEPIAPLVAGPRQSA